MVGLLLSEQFGDDAHGLRKHLRSWARPTFTQITQCILAVSLQAKYNPLLDVCCAYCSAASRNTDTASIKKFIVPRLLIFKIYKCVETAAAANQLEDAFEMYPLVGRQKWARMPQARMVISKCNQMMQFNISMSLSFDCCCTNIV